MSRAFSLLRFGCLSGAPLLWVLCMAGGTLPVTAQEIPSRVGRETPVPFSVALRAHLRPPSLDMESNVVLGERDFLAPGEREREAEGPTPEAARAAVEAGTAGPLDYFSQGFALVQAGKQVEALESFNQSFALWRRAIALAPEDLDARMEFARALGRFGRTLGSRRALEDALPLLDSVADGGGARAAEAALGAAIQGHFLTLVVPGDPALIARARRLCERALQLGGRTHFALFALQQLELSSILSGSQAYEGRESSFYELLSVRTEEFRAQTSALEEPALVQACLNLGLSFMGVTLPLKMPGFQKAPELWSSERQAWTAHTRAALVACLPELVDYPKVRAVALERIWQLALLQGDRDESVLFERARAGSLNSAGLAELRLAFASSLGRVELQAQARVSLLAEREDARTWIQLGTQAFRAGDFVVAAEDYQKATRDAPERFEGWLGWGSALLAGGGDGLLALPALERAAGLEPGRVEVHVALAVGYALARREGEASLAARAAVALDPSDLDARAVSQLLTGD